MRSCVSQKRERRRAVKDSCRESACAGGCLRLPWKHFEALSTAALTCWPAPGDAALTRVMHRVVCTQPVPSHYSRPFATMVDSMLRAAPEVGSPTHRATLSNGWHRTGALDAPSQYDRISPHPPPPGATGAADGGSLAVPSDSASPHRATAGHSTELGARGVQCHAACRAVARDGQELLAASTHRRCLGFSISRSSSPRSVQREHALPSGPYAR